MFKVPFSFIAGDTSDSVGGNGPGLRACHAIGNALVPLEPASAWLFSAQSKCLPRGLALGCCQVRLFNLTFLQNRGLCSYVNVRFPWHSALGKYYSHWERVLRLKDWIWGMKSNATEPVWHRNWTVRVGTGKPIQISTQLWSWLDYLRLTWRVIVRTKMNVGWGGEGTATMCILFGRRAGQK